MKLKKTAQLSIIFIVSVLLNVGSAQQGANITSNVTEIKENGRIELNLTMKQTAHYKYLYTVEPEDNGMIYDLSIDVTPLDGLSDPDVFVSKNKPIPDDDLRSADDYDTSLGYDIVVIPKEKIQANDVFYITVLCSSEKCRLRLNVEKTESYSMNSSETIHLYFSETAEEIVRIYIPPSTPKNPITRIIISAVLLNSYMIEEPFHMYADKNQKLPGSSSHDLSSQDAWFNGKAIVIYNSDSMFCCDCNYTVLIQAAQNSLIKLTAETYGHNINMLLGETKQDAVDFGENITYIVDLTAAGNLGNETLIIQFTPYEGRASLKANPNALPVNDFFYWSSNYKDSQEIIITAEDRAMAGLQDALYIVVIGHRSTTFELKVYSTTKGYNQLRLGIAALGYVSQNETVNYILPIFSNEPEDIKIMVTEVFGFTDVFVKSCKSKLNCIIPKTEIDDYYAGKKTATEKGDIFLVTDTISGSITLSWTHFPANCTPDSFIDAETPGECYYAVCVINSGTTLRSRYNLNAFVVGSIVQLPEGMPLHGKVALDEDDYYSFTVSEDTVNTSIVLQVTAISGEVDIFVSKKERYPSSENFQFRNNFLNTIVISKEDTFDKVLTGTYYINVHGIEAATYSILAYYQRPENQSIATNQTDDSRTIELNEGIPQHFTLMSGSSVLLSLSVSFLYGAGKEIDIVLQPGNGKYSIYATNGNYTPTKTNYQYQSNSTKLAIKSDSPYFISSGTYLIRIYGDSGTSANNTLLRFTVTYVTSKHFVTLRPRDVYSDYIDANRTMFFRFEIRDDDDAVSIVVSGDQNQIILYASLDSDNPFPSSEKFDIKADAGVEVINLNSSSIEQACKKSNLSSETGTEDHRCFIFLALVATGNSYYSLTCHAKGSYLQIFEGTSTTIPMGNVNTSSHIYFVPTQSNVATEIMITSEEVNLEVYASIIDRRLQRTIKEWSWPTNASHSFSSSSAFNALRVYKISIPAPEISKRSSKNGVLECAIALTVINSGFDKNKSTPSNSSGLIGEYTFTVIATSDVVPLEMGKPMIGYVEKAQYKYFQVRIVEPKCVLLIILTPLTDGDPDLFVSFGSDVRPAKQLGNVDFMSSTFKGEQLEISNSDILPRLSMEGIWTIGVYGYANCSFTITVTSETEKVIPIMDGVPADFDLEPGEIQYFEWDNLFNNAFSLIISKEEGHVITTVNTMTDDENLLEKLPKNNGTWVSDSLTWRNVMKFSAEKDGEKFCIGCTYLIGVSAKTYSRGFIVISQPGKPIYLQDGRSLRYTVEKDRYEYFQYLSWEASPKIDINMILYSGNPEIYINLNNESSKTDYKWSITPHKGEKLINLQIRDANGSNDLNIFHIAVYGREASTYLIMAAIENTEVNLNEGVLTYGFINSHEYRTYQFYCSQDYASSNQRLKIFINVYNDRFTKYENLTYEQIKHVPTTEITFDNFKKGFEKQVTTMSVLRNETIYQDFRGMVRSQQILQVQEFEGLYTFNLSNPYDHSLNFSIIANRFDIFTLPLGTAHMSRVGVGEIEMYELYANETGLLALKAVSCFGAVKLGAATTLANLQKRDYDLEVSHQSSDEILYDSIPVQPGMIYVAVQGIEGTIDDLKDPTKEALYKFEATLFPNNTNELPINLFKSGNNGKITMRVSDRDNFTKQVEFEWAQIQFSKRETSTYSDFSVDYSLIITKDPIFTQSYGLCAYLPVEFSKISERDTFLYRYERFIDYQNYSVNDSMNHTCTLAKDEVYYVTVSAIVRGRQDGIETWNVPVFYEIQELNLIVRQEPNQSFLFELAAVCAVGIIGVLLLACWFCCRYKKITRELKYEVMGTEGQIEEDPSSQRSQETNIQAPVQA